MREVAPEPLLVVIETDDFGGRGDQAAAVYRGDREVMAPAVGAVGPINEALRHLGVRASAGMAEFDTVGLGQFRDSDDLFDAYRGEARPPRLPVQGPSSPRSEGAFYAVMGVDTRAGEADLPAGLV